jgi:uncharacterized membrane protein YfcA
VDSVSGGGGLISLPAYTLAGLPYGLASGCNKFSACFGTASSVIRYFKGGKILWLPALIAAVGALPGAWLGTKISMMLSNQFMNIFMIVATPIVGVLVVLKKDVDAHPKAMTKKTLFFCLLSGLIVGAYDGFFGPGTGTFLILLFTALTGMDMVTASATAKPVNLASNISSLITRIAAGNVLFALALPAVCCSIAGGWLGAKLALTRGAKLIRVVMLCVLTLLTVRLAVEWLA